MGCKAAGGACGRGESEGEGLVGGCLISGHFSQTMTNAAVGPAAPRRAAGCHADAIYTQMGARTVRVGAK